MVTLVDALTELNMYPMDNFIGVNIKDHGAIGDGDLHPLSELYPSLLAAQAVYPHATALTDQIDWCAIQGACDAAFNTGYTATTNPRAPVLIPRGDYMINQQITSGNHVPLIGIGPYSSRIHATSDFPADTSMFQASFRNIDGTGYGANDFEFNNGIRDLGLYADGNASTCLTSYDMNEHGGLYNFVLADFTKYGAVLGTTQPGYTGKAINYMIDNGRVYTDFAEDDTPVGIWLASITHPLHVDRISVSLRKPSEVLTTGGIGILSDGGAYDGVMVRECSFENCLDGFKATNGRVIVENCAGKNNCTNVVHFATRTGGYAAKGWAEMITNDDGGSGGVCVKNTVSVAYTIGVGVMMHRAVAGRENGLGGLVRGFTDAGSTDASGFLQVAHGLSVTPRSSRISVYLDDEGSTRLFVMNRAPNSTHVRCRIWDDAAPGYLASTSNINVSWECEP
jgi:hypothetical protein